MTAVLTPNPRSPIQLFNSIINMQVSVFGMVVVTLSVYALTLFTALSSSAQVAVSPTSYVATGANSDSDMTNDSSDTNTGATINHISDKNSGPASNSALGTSAGANINGGNDVKIVRGQPDTVDGQPVNYTTTHTIPMNQTVQTTSGQELRLPDKPMCAYPGQKNCIRKVLSR